MLNANLATKADVASIEERIAKVEAGIEALRLATNTDIAKVETRMEAIKFDLTKWLIGALIAQGGLIVALVKLL